MPKKRTDRFEVPKEGTSSPSMSFRAAVGLHSDTTGRDYEKGDLVTTEDFSLEVLEHWAEIGRVVRSDG